MLRFVLAAILAAFFVSACQTTAEKVVCDEGAGSIDELTALYEAEGHELTNFIIVTDNNRYEVRRDYAIPNKWEVDTVLSFRITMKSGRTIQTDILFFQGCSLGARQWVAGMGEPT